MRAIIGLGNPGGRYQLTRHNVGFMFVDYLAEKYGVSLSPSRFDYYQAEGSIDGNPFVLIKPTTFVNNSGSAVAQFQQQFNLKTQEILVIYDDLNLPMADIRIRFGGSHGGHNGIYSLIYHLNTNQFPRLRIGIGGDFDKGKMAQFVLGKLSYDEFQDLGTTFDTCEALVRAFLAGGVKQMLDENSKMKDVAKPVDAPDSKEQTAGENPAAESGADANAKADPDIVND
ncbi:MAG: aminoacyl-tRNA hydrolase [Ignavibacteria bacterium]|nr:aminoacyl-tRNA hydrolase [Ignavibacteria bacterium]